MSRAPRKLTKGQQLAGIPTDDWNAFCDLWHTVQQMQARGIGTGASAGVPHVVAEIQNTTGDLIDCEFPVLALGDPVFTYTDNTEAIREAPQFKGTTPDSDTTIGDIAIVQGPIGDDEFREAILQGPTHCEIDVTDEAHTHAQPKDGDNTKLQSGTSGAKIHWKESGTGTKKAVVMLGGAGGGGSGNTRVGVMIAEAEADYGTPGFAILLDGQGEPIDADGERIEWDIFDTEGEDFDEEVLDEAKVEVLNPDVYEKLTEGSRVWLSSHTLAIVPGARSSGLDDDDPKNDKFIVGGLVSIRDSLIQFAGCADGTALVGASSAGGLKFEGEECPEPEEEE